LETEAKRQSLQEIDKMRADVAGFKALMEDDDMVRQNSSQNSSKERVKNQRYMH